LQLVVKQRKIQAPLRSRGLGLARVALAGGLCCLLLALTGMATATGLGVLVEKGHIGQRHWYVTSAADNGHRGICLEVGVYYRKAVNGASGAQCSAPSPRRGIVIATVRPRQGRPAVTAVGGAFANSVHRVEEVRFDGSARSVRLLTRGKTSGSAVGRYRYIAFAIDGPWCVERLVTYDANDEVLWDASFSELASIPSELFYDPQRVCPSK
jgi:hypothetical protein